MLVELMLFNTDNLDCSFNIDRNINNNSNSNRQLVVELLN